MLDTTATNVQVLSAMDFGAAYGRTPDLDALVADFGDALLRAITHEVPHWRDGHPVTEHLLVFDAGRLRKIGRASCRERVSHSEGRGGVTVPMSNQNGKQRV